MKTITANKCSNIAMVNGGEETHHKVIHNGYLKEWVGFGWIEIRKATLQDISIYPTVVYN